MGAGDILVMVVTAFFSFVGGMATFTQVLLALPMTLDLLGTSKNSSASSLISFKVPHHSSCSRFSSRSITSSTQPSA